MFAYRLIYSAISLIEIESIFDYEIASFTGGRPKTTFFLSISI